jgi:hypothetical protein
MNSEFYSSVRKLEQISDLRPQLLRPILARACTRLFEEPQPIVTAEPELPLAADRFVAFWYLRDVEQREHRGSRGELIGLYYDAGAAVTRDDLGT